MDKDTILYATVDEQIEKLKKQGLIINSLDFARSELALYGYSNLIKSYRDPYMIMSEEGSKSYRSGITFEQIQSLYILDKNLRNAVMASMLDLEEYVKRPPMLSLINMGQIKTITFNTVIMLIKRKENNVLLCLQSLTH